MLLSEFQRNTKGNLIVILENGYLIPAFIERVAHLCDNDPYEYKGSKVLFEFSLDSSIRNLVVFCDVYTQFCRENKNKASD